VTEPDADVVRTAIADVRRGDRDAYGRIVDHYGRRLFGLALMMTRDPSAAEEVAQDAFVRAFQHLDDYDQGRPFYPWISTITVRLAQNWLVARTRVTTREGTGLDAVAPPIAPGADPLATLITDEGDRQLWESVAALPSGERTSVILYYRQDMSVGDIARALGVTSGTIKTLLFRARARLRLAMGEAPPGTKAPGTSTSGTATS